MYKLYQMTKHTLIDTNEKQDKLLEIMARMYKVDPEERFLLVQREGMSDVWFKGIYGVEEYNEYIEKLQNDELKNRSCVDLKRDIVDLACVKTKKLTRKK